jgi:ATP-dependent helicase/nuclease subunit A
MQRELASRARSGGYSWQERELHLSFRSTPVILDAVDAVFAPEAVHRGLTAGSGAPAHSAQRRGDPGRVVVWPIIKPAEPTRPTDWATPLDHLSDDSPEVQLAKRIAGTIRGWRDGGEVLDAAIAEGKPRPIRAGGFSSGARGAMTDAINGQRQTDGVSIAGRLLSRSGQRRSSTSFPACRRPG